jgi:hypothetical protein
VGAPSFASFAEFWPFYLGEHNHPVNRRLHAVGTSLALLLLVALVAKGAWLWLGLVPLVGYGFAWVGHFAFEKNKPASFAHPLYSFRGDLKLWALALTGRLPPIGS